MVKSSRVEMEKHRREIVDTASHLLRERGESAVSVQKVMGDVGLTHGGFYKHFSSKDELMDLAAEESFSELIGAMNSILESATTRASAWGNLVDDYLSDEHRENRAGGCANTALASDSARAGDGSGMRTAYVHGVSRTLDALRMYQDHPDDSQANQARLQAFITMVGALTLSRATAGTELSDDIVVAAKALLLDRDGRLAEAP